MLRTLRNIFKKNIYLRKLVGYHAASSGLFDNVFRSYKLSALWQKRTDEVCSSSDNKFIPRVADAGLISKGKQTMHNGLRINLGSYYGPEYSQMLLLNKGVHEPQEERVFAAVLPSLPAGALMIEMGAFWSFYSMWFNREISGAVNYMIEPDSFNMGHGQRNFRLNGLKGNFVQAFIGSKSEKNGSVPTIAIDDFVKEKNISFIHMLHSDIQGFEYDMLQGARNCFENKMIGYVFISTHSDDIHYKCLGYLKGYGFNIIAEADLKQTFSEDGLIAARAPYFPGIDPIAISRKHQDQGK